MAFLIVLNNIEPDILIGLLSFFIANDSLFKLPNDRSLDYLVVAIEELTICHNRNATFIGI
jgi:hypothetical protein